MRRLLITFLVLLGMAGCSRQNTSGPLADAPTGAAQGSATGTDGQRRTLAYQHSIQIDTQEAKVAPIYEAAMAACRAASDDLCTLLESHIGTGRLASASLRFRAKPGGIAKLVVALGKQADITEQSTKAEDLAGPIQDGDKKLAMLTTYRAELEELRSHAGNGVDALIKLSHELAEVQSELETAGVIQARLMQRVQTETLDVTILSERNQSFWKPISLATSDFGSNFSQGVSTAITGTAYLIPWVFLIGLAVWIARTIWRRRNPR